MIQLNRGQEDIVSKAIDWYKNSSEQVFQIAGNPGTGKSVVMKAIADRLVSQGFLTYDEILPMAYTGQAAIVMRTKGFPNARSIHSSIYTPEYLVKIENGNTVMNTTYNAPEMQIQMVNLLMYLRI